MRTTVDIPDELYRQAKAQAALRGIHLRELVEEGLRRVLGLGGSERPTNRITFPLIPTEEPGVLTFEEVCRLEAEEFEAEDRLRGGAL